MLTICRREKNGNEFLEYYVYMTREEAENHAKTLNTTHPSELFNGIKVDWNKTIEFFVHEQDPMY